MITRIALVAAALALAAFALWRPAAHSALQPAATSIATTLPSLSGAPPARHRHRRGRPAIAAPVSGEDMLVYVAGAVRKPGLYHLQVGDRVADAVTRAGGLSASADAAAVNLAARAADGDEIYAPAVGESAPIRMSKHRARSRAATPPPAESVDVNTASAAELARVPGLGHAIAQRIVDVRDRDGAFASLDELLDVAGMTETHLERARPFLQSL